MVKKTSPRHRDRNTHVRPQPFTAIFARQLVRVRALLPFGYAALKSGSAIPRPIASKAPRADDRWKIVPTLIQVFLLLGKHTMRRHFLAVAGRAGLLLAAAGVA